MTSLKESLPALPKCSLGHEIPIHVTLCVVCGESVGYPNVRYAGRKEEVAALEKRVADARISATAKGSLKRLEHFGQLVANSKAVISRSRADLDQMLSGSGKLMQAFYPAVRAGLRIPENNEYDPSRILNDGRINPYFYEQLHFGALSLNSTGIPHYGDFAITLRTQMISNRTTVFEENPFVFNQKHPPSRAKPVPFGYRATWRDRNKLAMAKLHSRIEASTPDAAFADILLEKQAAQNGDSDFIEVHVYGDVHPHAFEHVRATVDDDEVERLLWGRMKERLDTFGVSYEEAAR